MKNALSPSSSRPAFVEDEHDDEEDD